MTHSDFNETWLEEDLDGYARDAFHGKADGEHRDRIIKRNRYILGRYLEEIAEVGRGRALQSLTPKLEGIGISYSMITEATKGWRDSHRPIREFTRAELVQQQLDAATLALVRAEERMLALEDRVAALEAVLALGTMAAVESPDGS